MHNYASMRWNKQRPWLFLASVKFNLDWTKWNAFDGLFKHQFQKIIQYYSNNISISADIKGDWGTISITSKTSVLDVRKSVRKDDSIKISNPSDIR